VDRAGSSADGNAGFGHEPVCGYTQNSLGTGGDFADAAPAFGVAVGHHGIHGIAVPEKDCRENFCHDCSS
jgi:hypothetical protein